MTFFEDGVSFHDSLGALTAFLFLFEVFFFHRGLLDGTLFIHNTTHKLLEQKFLAEGDFGHIVGGLVLDLDFQPFESILTAFYFS